jgi:hypothetical protein
MYDVVVYFSALKYIGELIYMPVKCGTYFEATEALENENKTKM